MHVALSIMLMQECCNFICQWENEPGGVPIRIKHLFILYSAEIIIFECDIRLLHANLKKLFQHISQWLKSATSSPCISQKVRKVGPFEEASSSSGSGVSMLLLAYHKR